MKLFHLLKLLGAVVSFHLLISFELTLETWILLFLYRLYSINELFEFDSMKLESICLSHISVSSSLKYFHDKSEMYQLRSLGPWSLLVVSIHCHYHVQSQNFEQM